MKLFLPLHTQQFQSTLLRKERLCRLNQQICRYHDFNPRSYARSDLENQEIFRAITISIHAPTQGATAKLHRNYKLPLYKLYNIFKMTQYLILLIIKKITKNHKPSCDFAKNKVRMYRSFNVRSTFAPV